MARKRMPILQNLLKVSIFITKIRKPILARLNYLVNSKKGSKKFKLLSHYNYEFLEEYEFTPSSTALLGYDTRQLMTKKRLRSAFSMFFLCRCLGELREYGDFRMEALPLEVLPAAHAPAPADVEDDDVVLCSEEEEDSVDERAERFIEWFYEEMRIQRRLSA